MNKKWEGRLITLTPGSRRRVRLVGKKLAALLPWKAKAEPGAKRPPAAVPGTAFVYSTNPPVAEWRTGKPTAPSRAFHVVRNPAAGTLTRDRRLARAALKLVKSGPHS